MLYIKNTDDLFDHLWPRNDRPISTCLSSAQYSHRLRGDHHTVATVQLCVRSVYWRTTHIHLCEQMKQWDCQSTSCTEGRSLCKTYGWPCIYIYIYTHTHTVTIKKNLIYLHYTIIFIALLYYLSVVSVKKIKSHFV